MDDISRELGISKKTLYQHFKNKNDLIYKVTQFELKNECVELDKLCDIHSNAYDQLLIISKYIVRKLHNLNSSLTYGMYKYYPQIWEKLNNQRKEYLLALIKQNFQTGMKQGIYRSNLNSDSITIFYTFLFDIKGFEIYKEGLNSDFDKMFNSLFMYHIWGIANNNGIEYLDKQFKNKRRKLYDKK
jgi:hypothetical protein